MHPEHEKEVARLEERFGHRLGPFPSYDRMKQSRLWTFLNSAFGLWLLSTVVLSGGTALLAKWYNERDLEQQRHEKIEMLDLEIGYRLSTAIARLAEAQIQYELGVRDRAKKPTETLADQRARTAATIRLLNYAGENNFPALYPEYSKYGLPALIAELRRNERSELAKTALHHALRQVLSDAALENTELPPKNWIVRIRKSYMLPRWATDFDVADPFGD
jgi:hypothetical protein